MSASVTAPSLMGLVNLLAPASGTTHACKFTVTLAGAAASINWPGLFQAIGVWVPQSMMVDNTAGTAVVTVKETTYGWTRSVQAGQLRVFQFPAVGSPIFVFSSTGNVSPVVSMFDWPAFPDADINLLLASGTPVSITGQPVSVSLSGTMAPSAPITYATAASTTIATGGTSQTVFTAGTLTNGGWITNPASAAESLYFDPTGAACLTTPSGTTFELKAGQTATLGAALNAVTVNAVTLGHVFSAVRF
jgi:hypothetical protein